MDNKLIKQYLKDINNNYKTGIATEHTYRADLQKLIKAIEKVNVINEPKRSNCGAPDYVVTKGKIPLGYIEAKDIGKDLNSRDYKEQFGRYKKSLNNLIITDYLCFQRFIDGAKVAEIKIAELEDGKIHSLNNNFDSLIDLLKDFCSYRGQTIRSATKLSKIMAGKAKLLAEIINNAIEQDIKANQETTLKGQMEAFRSILIHDITPKDFADIYAQTIGYGMFAARLHDTTLDDFSRQEAAVLIPKSNPFLRNLFQYIAGYDLDDRIAWIVDDLAEIFRATNVKELMQDFGRSTGQTDPFIHFYETFLAEYDPKLRKSRGVWYTPEPVVNFIVRAVDDILKDEFGLAKGLADTSKTTIELDTDQFDKRKKTGFKKYKQEVHKVQILDPATGTGTFLAQVVKQIHSKFAGQQGIWNNYVDEHLIPRLNGFELLMASYAMAHLKMELLLQETGYKADGDKRLNIFLTNSLEEHHPDTGTLFASWLSAEANEANHIKRDTPVMCIIGNPPYSGESANKGEWIMKLMEDYKKEPGGKEKLKERNPKWINDDYVKFMRYAQHYIERNGEGILAFINPHGFLDNPTFRGMRWHLLKTYDKIYTIDLHGNSKKKEVCPDGSKDENVFDIMQGVSINLFVKTGKKKTNELGKVFHYDLYGKRDTKYQFLLNNSIKSVPYKKLPNVKPNYFFVHKDFVAEEDYNKGFKISELMEVHIVGIATAKDKILVNEDIHELLDNVDENFETEIDKLKLKKYAYRPYDNRFIYYDTKLVERAREKVMQHLLYKENIGLISNKQIRTRHIFHHWITNKLTDLHITETANANPYIFPLYLYPDAEEIDFGNTERVPNLDKVIVSRMSVKLGLKFVGEKTSMTSPSPPEEGLSDVEASPLGRFGGVEENSSLPMEGSGEAVPGYITANPKTYRMIKEMRDVLKANPTPAEKVLWEYVRNKKTGFKIRRQHIIHNFVTDFVCLPCKVVIEVDGKIHEQQREYDELRTEVLNQLGYKVIRFKNEEVLENPNKVADKIKSILLTALSSLTSPNPSKGGASCDSDSQNHIEGGTFCGEASPLGRFGGVSDSNAGITGVLTSPSPPEEGLSEVEASPLGRFGGVEESGDNNSPPLEGQGGVEATFAPIDILDYIYAVLHSPSYRNKYKEFLKIDFPRVPYPEDTNKFWQLVNLGSELRQIHLLESPIVEQYITSYPKDGDNIITRKLNKNDWEITDAEKQLGRIWINDVQYFDNIPLIAWEFYIGGYQPAQKWLKDRRGRELNYDDILHYQKIIIALTETDRLMKEIDKIVKFIQSS